MAREGKQLLVLEHDRDLARMLGELLKEEGFEVRSLIDGHSILPEVRDLQPDLIIVDIIETSPEPDYGVLDELRTDDIGKRIPVLTMGTSARAAQRSIASYNVVGFLLKPFELQELHDKIRQAIGTPPMHSAIPQSTQPASGVLKQAEKIIAQHSRESLFNWAQQLRQQEPWKGRSDLNLADVLNTTPVLVEAVAAALHYEDPERFFKAHPGADGRVRQHTAIRRSQQISLAALMREYSILRNELWKTIWLYISGPLSKDEMRVLQQVINGAMDRIMETTIPAYLENQSPAT